MATTKDYRLGEFTFPRGWFMIADADELNTHKPLAVRFFGKDFALYRGRSTGQVVLLDAHCPHMKTHLAAPNTTSYVVVDGGGTVDPPIPTKIDTLAVPGKFEAEKASTLSSGIQIEATTDAGGGSDLGYTTNGSAEYTIKVAQAGGYTLRARVATDESGTLTFKVNNNQIGTIAVSKTGGWQSWQTMETPVQINTAGVTKLQVGWTGAVNLNWLEIAVR